MKKTFVLLTTLLVLFSFRHIQAQTAEEIVATYLENIGGKDALSAVKSVKMTGTAKAQGMEFPVTMYSKLPGKQRMDLVFQGQEITQMAFDGETGWGMNFMTMQAEKWDQEQTNIAKSAMDFLDPFLGYADKGYVISLEGEEEVESTPCFKIKLTRKPIAIDGKEVENFSYYFFDKESFAIIMQQEFAKTGPMKGMATETYLSDYEEAGGIYFPHAITQKVNGQVAADIAFSSIEVNAEIDDKVFAFPETKSEGGGKN